MPLIPPLFVQAPTRTSNTQSGTASGSVSATFASNVTAGDLLIVFTVGENPDNTGGTLSLGSISDTLSSSWSRIVLSSVVIGTAPNTVTCTIAIWFAFANSSGANSVSVGWSSTGGNLKQLFLDIAEWKNVSLGGFDHLVSTASSSNPATTPTFTTSSNNELLISCWFYQALTGGSNSPAPWTVRVLAASPATTLFDTGVGQAGNVTSLALANDGVPVQSYFASIAGFFAAPPTAVTRGNGFFEDYPGMPWMKNVAFLCRNYWDVGLSQPTVGQEWPVPNTGGAQSGKTYPY